MTCEACGRRPATVRYAEVVDGSLSTWHLCDECARERGVGGSLTSLAGPLVNILMGLLEGGPAPADPGPACPHCGLTYAQFRRSGRLGCGTCYETLADELRPLLRRIHGSTEHTGRVPDVFAEAHARRREIRRLKAELARAVRSEDYERAAEIRDTIRSRERGLPDLETGDVDA